MSYDLTLPTICNHRISRELSYVAPDLRSVRVAQPMSNTLTVQVYASDNLVPMTAYSIILDPRSNEVNPPKMIYFKYNWKSPDDTFEVSYNTFAATCPKCGGGGALHDISYTAMGTVSVSRNENLLLQNMEKFIITESASNPFHSYLGTNLVSLLGEKIYDMGFVRTKITQEVMGSIDKLKELQEKYVASGRTMTPGETLDTVDSVDVEQDDRNPSVLRVNVEATAASGEQLTYVQLLKIA